MSRSSIWVMDKEFNGEELAEFNNSWLFTPILLDAIYHKYLPSERINQYGHKSGFMAQTMFDNTVFSRLNDLVNKAVDQCDRVCWEMSNQQIFFTKDKEFIAKSIETFADSEEHAKDLKYPEAGHIHERFYEIAKSIREIDEVDSPYFVFKNTSCDDGVERWFEGEDDETGDYTSRPLSEVTEHVGEFVNIENDKVVGFTSNMKYFGHND